MILDFFKSPTYVVSRDNSFKDSLRELFTVLLYCYLFLFVNYLFVSIVDAALKSFGNFSFLELIDKLQEKESGNRSVFFFLIFSPIIEEIIFRLPLTISKINIFISFVAFYILFNISNMNSAFLVKDNNLLFVIFHLFIGGVIIFLGLKNSFLKIVSSKYYPFYFYGLAIFFGLLHITNFISLVPENLVVFSPIFAFHQIICGLFLGYIRIKRGLMWSIFLHILFNLPPTIHYIF